MHPMLSKGEHLWQILSTAEYLIWNQATNQTHFQTYKILQQFVWNSYYECKKRCRVPFQNWCTQCCQRGKYYPPLDILFGTKQTFKRTHFERYRTILQNSTFNMHSIKQVMKHKRPDICYMLECWNWNFRYLGGVDFRTFIAKHSIQNTDARLY